ncbi:MAG: ATP-binding cassette domain-containing protein [Oscillospiraceae bacterium]|nr:ATP-binding cassette domain-containing protein [Oscillospiraceae bacterium]
MAIVFNEVDFSYDGINKILDKFSLAFPEKGAVCLSGPSGCGKTTLLRLLAGLEKPQGGIISGMESIHPAFVFQENRLLPWMSALDNVELVCAGDGRVGAEKWLNRVGLVGNEHKMPGELSGGMKRRIAIARALAAPADFLILDEPFTGLDKPLWKSIADHISDIYADKLVIMVTHITEHAYSLNAKVIKLNGPPLGYKY